MRRLLLALAAFAVFAIPVAGAAAAGSPAPDSFESPDWSIAPAEESGPYWLEEGEEEGAGPEAQGRPAIEGNDVVPGATWAIVGTLIGCVMGGVFYLLKRRVGGFPAHPAWVAPISIERSATFATEGTFGPEDDEHGHGHAAASHH